MTPTPKQKKLFAVITSRCNLKVCFVKISKAFGQSLFFAGEKLLNNEDNTYIRIPLNFKLEIIQRQVINDKPKENKPHCYP